MTKHLTTPQHSVFDRVRNTPVTHLGQVAKSEPRYISGVLTTAALGVAVEKFANIARKGGDTPYLSHLLAVSALVMEHGGSEEQAAAALLHDIIEDCDVSATELVALLVELGADQAAAERVTQMVEATTDGQASDKRNKSDWLRRKQTYLGGLAKKSPNHPALLVSLADKVHNAEATLAQIRETRSNPALMVLLCRTTPREECARSSDGMSVLLVDMREAVGNGLTIRPIRTMLNHATTELFFDDLKVPVENLIGEEGKGFRYILSGMNAERILIASECIGDGRFFIDRATFIRRDIAACKSGCNTLIKRRAGKKVTGELFYRELVKRHVCIQSVDHPVPPDILVRIAILLKTI